MIEPYGLDQFGIIKKIMPSTVLKVIVIEELLEMIGIIIFIHGLSTYYTEILDSNEVNIRITLRKGRRSRSSP